MDENELFVVMTNSPGPGADALLRIRAKDLADRGYIVPDGKTLDGLADAARGACELVEVEDGAGRGFHTSRGLEWREGEGEDPLWRLGPFYSTAHVTQAIGRLYGCLIDPGDGEQVPEGYREGVLGTLKAEDSLTVAEMPPDVFLETWMNCMATVRDDLVPPGDEPVAASPFRRDAATSMRLLVDAEDVDEAVLAIVSDVVDGFYSEPGEMDEDELIDRVCDRGNRAGWDIEKLDAPAARKILAFARRLRREL